MKADDYHEKRGNPMADFMVGASLVDGAFMVK
jgi:hypothetical protein